MSVARLLETTGALILALCSGETEKSEALVAERQLLLDALGSGPAPSERERTALLDADVRLRESARTVRDTLAEELLRTVPPPRPAPAAPPRYLDRQG